MTWFSPKVQPREGTSIIAWTYQCVDGEDFYLPRIANHESGQFYCACPKCDEPLEIVAWSYVSKPKVVEVESSEKKAKRSRRVRKKPT